MNDSNSLKILFIWHHHQPYYKTDSSFLMPWVRMHGAKDYWDMVRILDDFPSIKQVFNFTPSLLEQIKEYLHDGTTDIAYDLSAKKTETFTDDDKLLALKTFFLANSERMIKRYLRYAELFEMFDGITNDDAIRKIIPTFSAQDFRDLQVWWNLSWVGEYSRFDPPFKYYLDKQRNFTEEEKLNLLTAQLEILRRIVPHHVEARNRRQIEISVSPFYHPILPLLCDTNSGKEANPETPLPEHRFRRPEDAAHQIKSGLDYARKTFGFRPKGMWPSEGSVSDSTLKIMIENKVSWTATDELNLQKSLLKAGKKLSDDFLEKYFAYSFSVGKRSIKIFFRDHYLSDLIGFTYSKLSPDEAANDFISRLLKIRDSIEREFGRTALNHAVVPIILDGENAWEFYQSDGKDFLRTLYYRLTKETQIQTVLPSDVAVKRGNELKHMVPGSWINGDFRIWIGHQEDNAAWDFLFDARNFFERESKKKSIKNSAQVFRELMIAEGSDWCWWYGDEHKSPQADQFDSLFRYHLKKVYNMLGAKPPEGLNKPIKKTAEQFYRQPTRAISPKFGTFDKEWDSAAVIEETGGAMQRSGSFVKRLCFGNDSANVYIRIDSNEKISGQKIVVNSIMDPEFRIEIGKDFIFRPDESAKNLRLSEYYRDDRTIELAIKLGDTIPREIALTISLHDKDNSFMESFPYHGNAVFKTVQ